MFRIWVISNIQAAGKHLNIAGVIPIKLFDSLLDSAASIISICSIGSSRIGMYGESLVSWRSSATISWGFNNCSKCILNSSSDGASFCISSRSPFHPIDFHIFLWSLSFSNLFQRSAFPHGDGGDACLLAIGQQAISCFLNSWQYLLAHGLRKVTSYWNAAPYQMKRCVVCMIQRQWKCPAPRSKWFSSEKTSFTWSDVYCVLNSLQLQVCYLRTSLARILRSCSPFYLLRPRTRIFPFWWTSLLGCPLYCSNYSFCYRHE